MEAATRVATERPRIALLGCGRIAQRIHLPTLAALGNGELVAVAETDPQTRARSLAGRPTVAAFADYRELLDRCPVDATVICLPPALHAEAAIACFERGLHVYVEKPLAATVDQADAVIRAWKRAGTVGAIGHNLRFHPLVLQLRDAIARGEVGKVIGALTVFGASLRALPDWKRRRESGGGVLLDLVTHHVDLLRFVLGAEVAEVTATLRTVETEDDTAALTLRFENGPVASLFASLVAVEEDRVAIYGEDGGRVFDRYRSSRLGRLPARRELTAPARLRSLMRTLTGAPRALGDILRPPRERSFRAALEAFAAAAAGAAAPGSSAWPGADLDDGRKSLAVIAAAERAAASETPVVLASVAS